MTVIEMIQQLQILPPDALVVTEGYEDGYDAIKKVSLIKVEENPTQEWYVGKYIGSNKPLAMEVVFLNAETKAGNK